MFLGGVVPCVALMPVAAVVAWIMAGPAGTWSVVLGQALAAVFFTVGFWSLKLVLDGAPSLQLVGALTVYAAQALILFGLIDRLGTLSGLHGRAFALGALASVVAWQAGQVAVLMRRRTLIFDPVDTPAGPGRVAS